MLNDPGKNKWRKPTTDTQSNHTYTNTHLPTQTYHVTKASTMNVVANTLEPSITIDQLKQSRRSHKDEKDGVTLATQKFADTYKKMDS